MIGSEDSTKYEVAEDGTQTLMKESGVTSVDDSVGKPVGIALMTWLLVRFTKAELDPSVRWRELIGVAALAAGFGPEHVD